MSRILASLALALAPVLAAAQEDFDVAIMEPSSNTPVFGEVDFVINIYPDDVAIDVVTFLMDGQVVGERTEPPYRIKVQTGDNFDSRVFGVEVYSMKGTEPKRIEVRTPELQGDETLGV